jgi:hypothetical protein
VGYTYIHACSYVRRGLPSRESYVCGTIWKEGSDYGGCYARSKASLPDPECNPTRAIAAVDCAGYTLIAELSWIQTAEVRRRPS